MHQAFKNFLEQVGASKKVSLDMFVFGSRGVDSHDFPAEHGGSLVCIC